MTLPSPAAYFNTHQDILTQDLVITWMDYERRFARSTVEKSGLSLQWDAMVEALLNTWRRDYDMRRRQPEWLDAGVPVGGE